MINNNQTILLSKYLIRKVLKKSEKTRVLLAVHVSTNSRRVIKEIVKDEEGLESLNSEVSILKHLTHCGIPKLYEVEETEHFYYIVEEYMEGQTLREIIGKRGPWDLCNTLFYGRQLAQIVQYLHSQKPDAILHLDLQPKNIMIHEKNLSLIDFGNATYRGKTAEKRFLKGTKGFAAPEQYGSSGIDIRTDVYGLGACLCYMLTGTHQPELVYGISKDMKEILAGCMAEAKSQRFGDVQILLDRLEELEKKIHLRINITDKKENGEINHLKKKDRRREKEMKKLCGDMGVYSVGILGIDKGEGVTSLAVGLASYLQELRFRQTAMVEMNREGEFEEIRDTYFGKECKEAPFEIFKINYYPGVTRNQYARICNMGYDCVVTDFGHDYRNSMEDFLRCDRKIIMGSINLWKYRKYLEFYEYIKNFPGVGTWQFILSGDEEDIRMIRAKHGIEVMCKQFFINPYHISEIEEAYYKRILF